MMSSFYEWYLLDPDLKINSNWLIQARFQKFNHKKSSQSLFCSFKLIFVLNFQKNTSIFQKLHSNQNYLLKSILVQNLNRKIVSKLFKSNHFCIKHLYNISLFSKITFFNFILNKSKTTLFWPKKSLSRNCKFVNWNKFHL